MQRLKLVSCALLPVLLACSSPPVNGLVVVVTVDPSPSGDPLVELRATVRIDGKASRPVDPIAVKPGTPTRFSLKLDQGTRGTIELTVEGRPSYAYVSHLGTSSLQIGEDRRYETRVELKYQTQCTDAGWCWEHAKPRGSALLDVWGTGLNDIWAVGEGGTLLHYDGWAFSTVPVLDDKAGGEPVINPRFTAVHGTNETDVWAISNIRAGVGQRHSLVRYDANLRKFVRVYRSAINDTTQSFISLWVTRDSLWIDGIAWNRQNLTPATAAPQTSPALPMPARPIFYRVVGTNPQDPNELWAVGSVYDPSKTYHDTPAVWLWQSSAWVRQSVDPAVENSNIPLHDMIATPNGDLWASGRDGTYNLLKTNSGTMWTKNVPPYPNHSGIIYAAHQNGSLLAISGNVKEKELPTPSRSPKYIFKRSSPSLDRQLTDGLGILRGFLVPGQNQPTMYLVGEGGLIQQYDVDNNELTELVPGTNAGSAHLNDIFGFSDADIWAVGNQGTVLHYNGKSWTDERARNPKSANHLRAVWGAASDDVWMVGENSTILHRTASDGAFAAVTSPTAGGVSLNGVWGTGPRNVYIVGGAGTLLHWDGASWMSANTTGFTGDFQGIWARDQDNIFVAGFSGTVGYVYKGDGVTWRDISPSGLYRAINKIRGSSTDNVVITEGVENGQNTWVYNGSGWLPLTKSTRFGVATFGRELTHLVGYQDTLLVTAPPPNDRPRSMGGSNFLKAMWGTAPNNLWAVGDSGTILHYQGALLP